MNKDQSSELVEVVSSQDLPSAEQRRTYEAPVVLKETSIMQDALATGSGD